MTAMVINSAQAYNPSPNSKTNLLQQMIENSFLRNVGLHQIISKRCYRYMPSYYEKRSCSYATSDMIRLLDFDIHFIRRDEAPKDWETGSYVFIAFRSAFKKLLQLRTINVYLSKVNEALYDYYRPEFNFNLWDFTVKFFNAREDVANYVIAVLFQDTSRVKLHVEYAYRKMQDLNKLSKANLDKLSETIDNFNFVLDNNPKKFLKTVFPKHMQENRNTSLYHFYVPMYLTRSLRKKGWSARASASTAFMLTLTYELVSSDPNDNKRYLFNDPIKVTSPWKIQDIYQGYSGAMMGAGLSNKRKSFNYSRNYFPQSTMKGAKYLLTF
jgi:hypothetical protein